MGKGAGLVRMRTSILYQHRSHEPRRNTVGAGGGGQQERTKEPPWAATHPSFNVIYSPPTSFDDARRPEKHKRWDQAPHGTLPLSFCPIDKRPGEHAEQVS